MGNMRRRNGSTFDASTLGNPSVEERTPESDTRTDTTSHPSRTSQDEQPRVLGDLLIADPSKVRIPESDWVAIVRAIAARDQAALQALYERSHRIAFTLIMRIVNNRETAEELTLDVFHDVWRRAPQYDTGNGPVLGWILNQARSRAIDRIRYELRLKRVDRHSRDPLTTTESDDSSEDLNREEVRRRIRLAVAGLRQDEREAIEAAYFSELTYVQAGARLDQPLGTIKTRIRSGLQKLRGRLAPEREDL
jgi:RNA polymerase sigma-70 factor, ECF subfamily